MWIFIMAVFAFYFIDDSFSGFYTDENACTTLWECYIVLIHMVYFFLNFYNFFNVLIKGIRPPGGIADYETR